ncbi:aldehyde dehydrogenase family 3 member F1 isoform X2 [Aegilops tauschii subsp. strangulata]|uniref:aldehyde dehydrogenase (NAD(+)) n=2 Tax=Aegilops tauschii subsp. strangulata TaxID=200361 RepID=A0A453CJR5_AEGTS
MGAPVAINGPIGERAITCSHSQWSTGAAEQSERVRAESMGSMVASVEEIGAAAAPQAVERRLGELRATFESGRTRPLSWRQSQLRGLLRLLADKEEEAFRALHDDLGKHRAEAYRDEVGVLTKSANAALREIGKWAAPEKASSTHYLVTLQRILFVRLAHQLLLEPNSAVSWMGAQVWVPLVAFPASAQVVPEPLGVVLIFSCWNFPLGLSLEPLIGAIAAGNAVALKPSELAPATARFLEENIGEYLDATAVKVIQGGPAVGEQLMEHRWDKVLFTGCPRVARVVMAAAVKHLTPVALELGGKCPCIFDAVAGRRNLQTSVNRVIFAKWSSCAGQACIAIDYVLVEERFAPTLIKLLKSTLKRFIADSDQMARIVNGRHFQRLSNLLKDPAVAASILHGGGLDAKNLSIEPTILLNPPLDSAIMTEEIFGPLLPIITVKKIEDSIAFVRARPKPLAVYAFTDSAPLKRRIVEETSSGSVTFNDAVVQFGVDTLPFGGVGQSGFGQYHGKYSFEMFSHKKAVLRRGFLVEAMLRYPPWDEQKIAMMRHLFRYDYVRFIFTFLGLRR